MNGNILKRAVSIGMTQQRSRRQDPFIDGSLALQIERERQSRREAGRSMRAPQRQRIPVSPSVDRELELERQRRTRRYARERERRLEQERQRIAAEEAKRREEEQRMERHRKGRRRAAAILVVTLVLAGLSFLLLYRQAQVETLIIDQNNIRSSIKSVTKQLEELQVQLNMKGDIGQIQEYAREQLSMDYPTSENTRTIVLP